MQATLEGKTPLHIAVINELPDVVAVLAANAAEILPNDAGETPLDLALNAGLTDIADALALLT